MNSNFYCSFGMFLLPNWFSGAMCQCLEVCSLANGLLKTIVIVFSLQSPSPLCKGRTMLMCKPAQPSRRSANYIEQAVPPLCRAFLFMYFNEILVAFTELQKNGFI